VQIFSLSVVKKGRTSRPGRRQHQATVVSKEISSRNWRTVQCPLTSPITLRMPISLARLEEEAVERFMKLIQADQNMKNGDG